MKQGMPNRWIRMPVVAGSMMVGIMACDGERLGPTAGDAPVPAAEPVEQTSATIAFAGGIPMGTFAQPTTAFGSLFNGAKLTVKPWEIMPTLAAVKARGGRVVLGLSGTPIYFKDAQGHFSFSKWKARIDRFRSKNFSSYIKDGTIVAHFLLDEPQDVADWNGQPVSPAMVEAMARYSKQIWPSMATVVRVDPTYLASYSGTFRYLDGAWSQYTHKRGDVGTYLARQVSTAQRKGLALVVGLNILQGGPNRAAMTASQVETWGSRLLAHSYPCAFLSWQYNAEYLSRPGIRDAMRVLRAKAQNRASKNCRGN